jgi:hypothetical protein
MNASIALRAPEPQRAAQPRRIKWSFGNALQASDPRGGYGMRIGEEASPGDGGYVTCSPQVYPRIDLVTRHGGVCRYDGSVVQSNIHNRAPISMAAAITPKNSVR